MSQILLVGLGNSLMGDDGVGPRAVEQLRQKGLPDGVRSCLGETDVLRLLGLWQGERQVWLVDALRAGKEPGTISRVSHDECLQAPQHHGTVHHLSLPESLRWMAVAEPQLEKVRYTLWGVEPAFIEPTTGLSPAVEAALNPLVSRLERALVDAIQAGDTAE